MYPWGKFWRTRVVINSVYYFVDSNLGVEILSKKQGLTKKEGEFWKLLCLGGCKLLTLGKEGFACWSRGRGNIQINCKVNFIQDSYRRFSIHFKSTFHWLLKVNCITKKCLFLENCLCYGSLLSVMRHKFSVLFYLKLYIF